MTQTFFRLQVIGCQPENSPLMYRSIQHGSIVDEESLDTLSDGTAGGIEKGAVCNIPSVPGF